ncbi:amidase [Paracoccaceae bacterium GXU_MW_L88]
MTKMPQSLATLSRQIASGDIDPVTLTEQLLDKIEGLPAETSGYIRVTPGRAFAEAMAARKRARNEARKGPLDGIPLSWKDLFDMANRPTEAGSALLSGRVPGKDAAVLAKLSADGAVCLGKTHMTELAFSGLGLNTITGTPQNAIMPGCVPGGSSSGAAVSVAMGLAAAGIGSDTGGSVRVPAAWNDLVGLKTSHGRISTDGAVPLCKSFDTVGPLTHSVEDAALLYTALGGGPVDLAGAALKGRHFVIPEAGMRDLDPTIAQAFETAVERLKSAGAKVSRDTLPEIDLMLTMSRVLFAGEAYAQWGEVIEAMPCLMAPPVLKRFRGGKDVTLQEFNEDWKTLTELRRKLTRRLAGTDGLLLPTAPILPPKIADLEDEEFFKTVNLRCLSHTRIGNLWGGAGLTLPTDSKACGLMLLGPAGSDAQLLRLGAAMEKLVRP